VTINTTQLCGGVNSSLSCNEETKQDMMLGAAFHSLKVAFQRRLTYKDITLTFVSFGKFIDTFLSRELAFERGGKSQSCK
jgi:hypothetical protein